MCYFFEHASFLVLLLSSKTLANPAVGPHPQGDLSDSFDVDIGAGYGVGFHHPSASLPKSTTTITHPTKNRLHRLLSDETVPQEIVTSRPYDFSRKPMDMKEIQNVLHDLDDSSEYSKVVQVVKVPAVYEIHVEKTQARRPQAAPSLPQPLGPQQIMLPILKHHFGSLPGGRDLVQKRRVPPARYSRPPQQIYKAPRPFAMKTLNSYSTLASLPPFDVKLAPAQRQRLGDDFVYGRQVERVLSPDEMNITVQPGATMVTFPKRERFLERSWRGWKCPEGEDVHRRVDDVFITTKRPVYSSRVARRLFSRGHGGDAVKYYVVINKKFNGEEDDE